MADYAILSDIHGNLQALQKVYEDLASFRIKGIILLGDLIDYGMQPNEVVRYIQEKSQYKIICNIWGNHERAIMMSDFNYFASKRGEDSARKTATVLDGYTRKFLDTKLIHDGFSEFELEGLQCLAVHGSLDDCYWESIEPEDVHGDYSKYQVVFSGHSHYSHMFTRFYEIDNVKMRNRHGVTFINPGSVGQPRNHHPEAQYAIFNSETLSVYMRSVPYDVEKAMSFFDNSVDEFYRDRLERGI